MKMNELTQKIFSTSKFGEIKTPGGRGLFFTGINGSIKSFVISYLFQFCNKKIVYCSNDRESLFKLKDDVNLILGTDTASIYIPEFDEEYESEVSALSSSLKKLSACDDFILLVEPSVFEKETISEGNFRAKTLAFRKGDELLFNELITRLIEFGFERKQTVEEENDFAVRGGIIDVYPENLDQPVRLEFFGNIIESIREFDLITQRSISHLDSVEILPSTNNVEELDNKVRIIEYLKENHLLLVDEPDIVKEKYGSIFDNLSRFSASYFSVFPLAKSESAPKIESATGGLKEISFNSQSQPSFHSNLKLLFQNLKVLSEKNFQMFITAGDQYQTGRFKELIEELDENDELTEIIYRDNSIHDGFILPEEKIAVYTEHQIFERYYRPAKRKRKLAGISFKDLTKVNNGDFMVHHNFGIGKYAGLRRINVGGVEQEAVKLLYKDNDTVFVNLNSLNLIKKYSAQEGHIPKLSKLGGSEWERIKQRTKKKIQDIARDLILLYSKRKSIKGFKFSPDSVWQKELEASFIYEDTPDQITATDAVKQDMETESPMDRLICGDVGFGKTEVAVRAAFKCVLDNKQAAVLVPTTILAEQHYNTFKDRLSNWAVEVEHLSRFKTKAKQKEILEKLVKGKINIIIGTHRLLSKDIKFKDLGLLIVDEEQRFGVTAKEKLKFMRETVDVLTLTATPIPRTLNFSLLGARDFSIINTPPKNRQPIHTEITNFDKKIVANAVTRELHRDGQVYLVNDKISKLEELAEMIEEVVPFAKVAVAHGQMNSRELENVMMKFLEKKYNVLVCTKIIESGLDIPSVNTIIINRADNFGLAELYQLRGRVGRSNIKSYAYLITPPHSILTRQAIRRLHALEEFTELGSGLNLALRDLEIRGAGNLLGREQSGFIAEIGFDMYMKILDEAVNELKGSEFGAVFTGLIAKDRQVKISEPEVRIETDISMLIPESYIEDENTRLEIYQRLSSTNTFDELNSITEETKDRFGKFPEEVYSLFKHVELKIASIGSGFEKIEIHGDTAKLYFHLSEESKLFKEGKLERMTGYISGRANMKMVQTKTSLILECKLFNYDRPIEKLVEVIEVIRKLKELS
jgi:transcription-repair coupling factor (superfamily II helicase)